MVQDGTPPVFVGALVSRPPLRSLVTDRPEFLQEARPVRDLGYAAVETFGEIASAGAFYLSRYLQGTTLPGKS